MKDVAKTYTRLEKIIDLIVFAGLVVFWIIIWQVNQKQQQPIPTHFNIQGTADAFGTASHLYTLAIINTALVLGMHILKWANIPLNFGQEITATNKKGIMRVMRQTLSLLALSILIIFGIILYETLTYTATSAAYLFILIFFSIKIPIIFYFAKTQNIK